MRRPALLLLVLAVLWTTGGAACGRTSPNGGDDGGAVVGRVMAKTDARACVSPDRGATRTCADVDDPAELDGIEVGMCAEATASTVEVVDDAECAAGDLGDG